MNTTPTIAFASLGCPKATVDSEQLLTHLRSEGYDLTDDFAQADLVVINTCGFIEAAIDESQSTIEEALEHNGQVIVTGCLGNRQTWLKEQFPDLLAITGPATLLATLTAIHTHLPPPTHSLQLPKTRVKLTPNHYAYLKIAEGCHQRCSFCVIPNLRGPLTSRPIDAILDEAQALVETGVKELLIIAQDSLAYGLDRHYQTNFWQGRPLKTNLLTLAEQLGQLGIWIRLHYIYPYPQVDRLIELMAAGHILPYLDIPLQHSSPPILKAMGRPANTEHMLQRIQQWRTVCSDLTIRSTFIVGFPGETEADFQHLLDFLETAQLDRVGAFTYSAIEGAAANQLPNAVAEELKEERLEALMQLQMEISTNKLQKRIGEQVTVLVDEVTEEAIYSRSKAEAPEIDGEIILVPTEMNIDVGDLITVNIINADEHDLYAELA